MKVLMVDQFLPNSVYVVELCRELRKYAKITIFCKKNAGTDLDGVIWKDKLYAGGKGKMAAVWEYGKGLFRLQKEIKKGSYDVVHVQSFKDAKYEIPLYCKIKNTFPVWCIQYTISFPTKPQRGTGSCTAVFITAVTCWWCIMNIAGSF